MKAVIATRRGDVSKLQVAVVPEPSLGPGEVLLCVTSTTVNYADYRMTLDRAPGALGVVPGHEALGEVCAVSDDVESVRVGQRVAAFTTGGSYCEYALASADLVVPVPDDVADDDAIGFIALATAYNTVVYSARLESGETVLVHAAAGGLGGTTGQIALALGARHVAGTVSSPAKAHVVERWGGTPVITDYGPSRTVDAVLQALGGPADVVLDSVGESALRSSLQVLAPFGRLVICGHTAGSGGAVPTDALHLANQSVIGYSGRLLLRHHPEIVLNGLRRGLDLVRQQRVSVDVGGRFSLADAGEALRRLRSRGTTGKVVLVVDQPAK